VLLQTPTIQFWNNLDPADQLLIQWYGSWGQVTGKFGWTQEHLNHSALHHSQRRRQTACCGVGLIVVLNDSKKPTVFCGTVGLLIGN
jgi:hypothetical protein